MRDDLPPVARFVKAAVGMAMGLTGGLMWAGGWIFAALLPLGFNFSRRPMEENLLIILIILFVGCVVCQIVGSAMYFFAQPLLKQNPAPVPTWLLPRWWGARLGKPTAALFAWVFGMATLASLFRLDAWVFLHAPLTFLAVLAFRYCSRLKEELTPPYPPQRRPRPSKTGD